MSYRAATGDRGASISSRIGRDPAPLRLPQVQVLRFGLLPQTASRHDEDQY